MLNVHQITDVKCRSLSYLPAVGRFLIVVTFLEDALRIMTQWSDQLTYLHDFRHSENHQLPCLVYHTVNNLLTTSIPLQSLEA
jgi:hypothetical protein